jgi:Leucine-rich repeat (LRR) protein
MEDIYYNIFTFLNVKDILTCSSVSKFFRNIYLDQKIWKSLIECNFKNIGFFKVNWYETYKLCCYLNRFTKQNTPYNYDNVNKIYELKQFDNLLLCNKPKKIPKVFGYLSNLTKVYLNHCNYEIIPTEIFNLNNLIEIQFSSNKISIIPTEIGQLSNLQLLSFSCNLIKLLPTEIGNLSNLRCLWLYENPIDTLPIEFNKLYNLERLHIYNTNITTLPNELTQLNKLKYISMNNGVYVPDGFCSEIIHKY